MIGFIVLQSCGCFDQFLFYRIQCKLRDLEQNEHFGLEMYDLPTQFAAYRAPGSDHHNNLVRHALFQ